MVAQLLLIHLIVTTIFSILALVSTALIIYRLHVYERSYLNDAELYAFKLLDEMLRSLLPRNLSKKLSEIYKVNPAGKSSYKDAKKVNESNSKDEASKSTDEHKQLNESQLTKRAVPISITNKPEAVNASNPEAVYENIVLDETWSKETSKNK